MTKPIPESERLYQHAIMCKWLRTMAIGNGRATYEQLVGGCGGSRTTAWAIVQRAKADDLVVRITQEGLHMITPWGRTYIAIEDGERKIDA